ncbi:hypothetical protein ENUP19_0259G0054 [Entamoeba nuttalli]|uniref:Leucine rich repeat protein, BspA family protein n=2 Tax=Entamoeba nuttalli TaxID=412467 RepID=K2GV79_ENTNP|nr:leucine rich repeat protein, BspA family protein [Entamoeba nuttalli P19]EKE38998.1 leucine rich repeat protein, BspA family protein [Entamoeba nuttalli P19]|eukprot:XP_008858668.1 leucine rich repeat protein, BspA family protein [Entamoeba nuttalli P19]
MGKIDAYSIMIICKYFINIKDIINVELVCKKYRGTMSKFHFNTVVLTEKNIKMFPSIQTQYIYGNEKKIIQNNINKYENWREIGYKEFINQVNKETEIEEIFHKIKITKEDVKEHFIEMDERCHIIDKGCFCDNHLIDNITIPNCITSIRNGIFMNCYGLTNVVLSDMISVIPKYCFKGCTSIQKIQLPFGIDTIEDESFMNCINLKEIDFSDHLISLGNRCFVNCNKLLEISLPPTIQSIGDGCFCNCKSLSNIITIGPTTNYGRRIFNGCENIPAIIITKEINELKSFEFSHCVGLRKVEIPSSVTKIEKYCFKDCKKLELITLHEGIEYENGCFEGCETLKEVIEMDNSLFETLPK